LRQAITPDALLGRVNASVRVMELGVMLVATVAAGLVGEIVGLRFLLVVQVFIMLLAALWLYLSPVRRLRTTPPAPDESLADRVDGDDADADAA
jgi:hypothetical protein